MDLHLTYLQGRYGHRRQRLALDCDAGPRAGRRCVEAVHWGRAARSACDSRLRIALDMRRNLWIRMLVPYTVLGNPPCPSHSGQDVLKKLLGPARTECYPARISCNLADNTLFERSQDDCNTTGFQRVCRTVQSDLQRSSD